LARVSLLTYTQRSFLRPRTEVVERHWSRSGLPIQDDRGHRSHRTTVELFRGLPEDRYVSASIDGAPYIQDIWQGPDRSKIRLKSFGPALSAHTRTGVSRRVRCCSENTPIRAMSRRSRLSAHCAILPRSPQFAVSIVSVTGCRHSRWWIRMGSWQKLWMSRIGHALSPTSIFPCHHRHGIRRTRGRPCTADMFA